MLCVEVLDELGAGPVPAAGKATARKSVSNRVLISSIIFYNISCLIYSHLVSVKCIKIMSSQSILRVGIAAEEIFFKKI